MSKWSFCDAILSIYTYKELPDFEKVINQMLASAPAITGSEGNCNYIPIDYFAGTSTNCDCLRCAFLNLNYGVIKDNGKSNKMGCPGIARATDDKQLKKCSDGMYIDAGDYIDRCRIIITCKHGLRDKEREDTLIEFNNLIKYIKSYKNKIFNVDILCKRID